MATPEYPLYDHTVYDDFEVIGEVPAEGTPKVMQVTVVGSRPGEKGINPYVHDFSDSTSDLRRGIDHIRRQDLSVAVRLGAGIVDIFVAETGESLEGFSKTTTSTDRAISFIANKYSPSHRENIR